MLQPALFVSTPVIDARTVRLFAASGYALSVVTTLAEAKKMMLATQPALLLINAPLADGTGQELALAAAERGIAVVLIVPADHAPNPEGGLAGRGIVVLTKPLSQTTLLNHVRTLGVLHRKIDSLHLENLRLRRQLEEIKLIERAKFRLMSVKGVDEAEAHRMIEKEAMNQRCSRREIAEKILYRD